MKVIATIDTRVLNKRLFLMRRNAQNLGDPLDEIRGVLLASIEQNFEEEGRPRRWKKLSKRRINQRIKTGSVPITILQDTGKLRNTINSAIKGNSVLLGSDRDYAEKLQKGSPKDKIPARPFLLIQDEDTELAKEILLHHLLKGVNR